MPNTANPLDALSYHELHPPTQPHERMYVSMAGTPSRTQPLTVQRLISQIRMELPEQRPFLIRLEKMMADFRGLTQVVEIKRPMEKDWNEQLQLNQKQIQNLTERPTIIADELPVNQGIQVS